jgi:hypothetical protein
MPQSVSNLFRKGGLKWSPDSDAVNAEEEALLRADNLVPDVGGALILRRGSSTIYTDLNAEGDVKALRTVELANGTTYRVAQVDNQIFINGASMGDEFTGSGDIAIGDDGYQIFMARGTTKKKFNGTLWMDWGIPRPEGTVTLDGIASTTKSASAFDSSESPASAATEGTSTATTDEGGTANAARLIVPAAGTSRAVVARLFTTDQDFLNIGGAPGSETDLFDMMLKLEEPTHSKSIQVIFGCDNSSTLPFTTDRFEFEFDLRNAVAVDLKDPKSEGFGSYDAAVQAQLEALTPQAVTSVKTPAAVRLGIANIGSTDKSPKAAPRPDAATWFHLSVTRGQFKRFGQSELRGWDTIRGFQVVYKALAGKTSSCTITDALMIGGGDRSLTGAFKCVVRAARETDQYTELSPPSRESDIINLNHQTLQITIPAAMVNSTPDEVSHYWVYLFGGFLDTYYRFFVISANPQSGMTIDELTTPDGSDFDDADERARITSWGFTMQAGTGSSDIVTTVDKSELDALIENEKLEPYQSGPVDNIISIAGPHRGRMYLLDTDGYIWPSTLRSPSGYNTIEVLDLTKYGDPLWMAATGSGIVTGMEKDIVLLSGSGDETPDLTSIDLFPLPLNIGNPPIDSMVHVDGNSAIYRSVDGLMVLTGNGLTPFEMGDISLLWRGINRHGVEALNTTTGRFRATVDDLMFYMLAPEGTATSTNIIYRFSFRQKQWSRLHYPQVGTFLSIFKEPTGGLIAGDDGGNLWLLDTGEYDNVNFEIPVNVVTPWASGQKAFAYKDPFDLQIHGDTGGQTATISAYIDGNSDEVASFTYSTTTSNTVYRIDASSIGRFLRAQLQFTGDFRQFVLQAFNLTYRERPQHSVYLDTGYILAAEPGQVVWIQHVEFDAITTVSPVTMEVWRDDVLHYSVDVDTSAHLNERYPFVIPVPRGTKARRPRIVFKVADPGEGAVGFDCYGVRIKMRSTGNQNGEQYHRVYPTGEAP